MPSACSPHWLLRARLRTAKRASTEVVAAALGSGAVLDRGGLAALVPARPGPRRAHKLTAEVVAFARERLEAEPSLRSAELVELIAERFGVRVHPRSVERALRRAARPKRGGEP